jgi:hypothetical protein
MYIELRNHSGLMSSGGAKCLAITLRRAGTLRSSGAEELLRNRVYKHLAAAAASTNWRSNLETGHKLSSPNDKLKHVGH